MNSVSICTKRSNKNHLVELIVGIKEKKLYLSCHYFVKYFKTMFEKEYSLEELQALSDYFRQFQDVSQIIDEFENNKLRGQEIFEELDDSKQIKVTIKLTLNLYKSIEFILDKKEKTEKEEVEELKSIVKTYENEIDNIKRNEANLYLQRIIINNMDSQIITNENQKKYLKSFISPTHNLRAQLLFSFTINYPQKLEYSIFSGYNFEINKNVKEFHKKCDKIKSILVICKSGSQIFGGYTPLEFSSEDKYASDNDSFLFSMNQLKKFPKNTFDSSTSIWGYKNYGPCFYYDLQFTDGTMSMIRSEKKNYLIPDNFIDKKKCIIFGSDILLECLEIYSIIYPKTYGNLFGNPFG